MENQRKTINKICLRTNIVSPMCMPTKTKICISKDTCMSTLSVVLLTVQRYGILLTYTRWCPTIFTEQKWKTL